MTDVAEALLLPDPSIDVVVMMKSLHHVPISQLDMAFAELARVLRPSEKIYICEPEYDGPFHDEAIVLADACFVLQNSQKPE